MNEKSTLPEVTDNVNWLAWLRIVLKTSAADRQYHSKLARCLDPGPSRPKQIDLKPARRAAAKRIDRG